MKMGLRMINLIEPWQKFEEKYNRILKTTETLYNIKMDPEEVFQDLENLKILREIITKSDLIHDTVVHLNKEIRNNKRIIVESASSNTMDIDTGLYPYTDSVNTTTGSVCTGLGVPEEAIETTIGVMSAI